MADDYLTQEIASVNTLTRSLKQAVRAKTQYNSEEQARTISLSEQIVLDAEGGAGT